MGPYNVLVFADGNYESLNSESWANVKKFANDGGTVIAVGSGAGTVARNLTDVETVEMKDEGTIQKPFASASNERALKLISGAIFKTKIDRTHPIGYGFPANHLAVFRNHGKILQPSSNPFANPVIYDANKPLMAGYCSDENVERFKGAASVVIHPVGSGRFVLMSDNPNFRGFWRGTSRLFMNAVFFGRIL